MRVGIVASDVPPCEAYRAGFAAKALADLGQIEVVRLTEPLRIRMAVRSPTVQEPVGIIDPPDVDVVVFVRGVFPARMHDVIRLLQDQGIAVVVDYDDDYRNLPPVLHNRYKINPSVNPYYNWRNAEQAGKLADAVTVSTPALRARHKGSFLLRNTVPRWYTEIERRQQDSRVIGWSGTIMGHPGDLAQTRGAVAQLLSINVDTTFLNIGDGYHIRQELGLDHEPVFTGIVPLDDYPYELARLDVGIAPLHDSMYSNAKSALKILEYMSAGAHYVASPSPEYVWLTDQLQTWCAQNACEPPGAIAASRGRTWYRELCAALRGAEDGPQVPRQFIRENHLTETHAHKWAEVWEHAIKVRKKKGTRWKTANIG